MTRNIEIENILLLLSKGLFQSKNNDEI